MLTLKAILVPITVSRTSNLLRAIETLFGVSIAQWRYYTFMASVKLPWARLWEVLWRSIPSPLCDGQLVLALDDSINPKTGKKIFACQTGNYCPALPAPDGQCQQNFALLFTDGYWNGGAGVSTNTDVDDTGLARRAESGHSVVTGARGTPRLLLEVGEFGEPLDLLSSEIAVRHRVTDGDDF